jgi:hypothetical protein
MEGSRLLLSRDADATQVAATVDTNSGIEQTMSEVEY